MKIPQYLPLALNSFLWSFCSDFRTHKLHRIVCELFELFLQNQTTEELHARQLTGFEVSESILDEMGLQQLL
jgi:hypothetical protein